MKITGTSETVEWVRQLDDGDRLTVGLTHQIQIKGDNSWVKFEANIGVRENETDDDAKQRVIGLVNQAALDTVDQVVETISNAY